MARTLGELILELKLTEEVNVPSELGNLTVTNEQEFCRHALAKYVVTQNFQDDLDHCLSDYELVSSCAICSLMLKRHKDCTISIFLQIDPFYH